MLSRTRTAVVTLASVAAVSLAPAVAQAQPVVKSPRPGMKGCTLKIGSNYSISVDDEGYVEIRGASGKFITLRCKDGKWYEEMQAPSTSVTGPLLTSPERLLSASEVVSSSPPVYTTAPLLTATRI
jgi:hypothetical protein